MKITLVAGDYAQSEVLNMLGQKLAGLGHELYSFLCYGKPAEFVADAVCDAVKSSDWTVVGMSERSDEEVVAVKEALKNNTSFALYADTFGAHRLTAFEFARDTDKATLFTVNSYEASDAKTLFPGAKVIVTGNPRWEEFAFPKLSRYEARQLLGIADEKHIVLSIGDKYLAQNVIQFGATIDAVRSLGWENNTEVILALHPGDLNDSKLYDELVVNAGCPVRIIGKHVGINTGEILVGCDLVIEFTSTIGIQAACLRLPIIEFCSTIAMRGKLPVHGKSPWYLAEKGASLPVFYGSSTDLAEAMNSMVWQPTKFAQQENQKNMFLVPSAGERGQALKLMCQALGT